MRRLAGLALATLLAACSGGGRPATAPAPSASSPPAPSPPATSAPATSAPPVFDPAAMDAALLAEPDLPEWELVGAPTSGFTSLFRFCGDSWTGLEAARGPRERLWTDDAGLLVMQDVRRYDTPAAARAAVASLAALAGRCDPATGEARPVRLPKLGDAAFGLELPDFRGREMVGCFVVSGRYGTVVVTDAEPAVPVFEQAAGKLAAYAAANP